MCERKERILTIYATTGGAREAKGPQLLMFTSYVGHIHPCKLVCAVSVYVVVVVYKGYATQRCEVDNSRFSIQDLLGTGRTSFWGFFSKDFFLNKWIKLLQVKKLNKKFKKQQFPISDMLGQCSTKNLEL